MKTLTKKQKEHLADLEETGELFVGTHCPDVMRSFDALVAKGFATVVDSAEIGKVYQPIQKIKLTGQGGPGRGQGRKPKSEDEKYQQVPLKLPPDLIDWLATNVKNRNGFIVDAIRDKIEACG